MVKTSRNLTTRIGLSYLLFPFVRSVEYLALCTSLLWRVSEEVYCFALDDQFRTVGALLSTLFEFRQEQTSEQKNADNICNDSRLNLLGRAESLECSDLRSEQWHQCDETGY